VASVYAAGVMGFAFSLATIVWELKVGVLFSSQIVDWVLIQFIVSVVEKANWEC
jgi:hypothetical protein